MAKKDVGKRQSTEESKFRIGAVSKITRIPVDTLRAWERRYQVVSPQRKGAAARLYTQEDVERLLLIKQLLVNGHAISSVANLDHAELEKRTLLHVAPDMSQDNDALSGISKVAIYSELRGNVLERDEHQQTFIQTMDTYRDWSDFKSAMANTSADAVIIEVATLMRERAIEIRRLSEKSGVKRTIVIYGFTSKVVLASLDSARLVAVRAPVDRYQLWRELGRPFISTAPTIDSAPVKSTARLFDDRALEQMANISSTVQCECPRHLVDIVRTLTQFEDYSWECESRSDEDAALHAKLRSTTAAARGLFERALIEVANSEGIALPPEVQIIEIEN